MNSDIINRLDQLLATIEGSYDMQNIIKNKKILMNNKKLLLDIENLKKMDEYCDRYIECKKKIMDNKDYMSYKESERNIYFLIQHLNKELKEITKEHYENN